MPKIPINVRSALIDAVAAFDDVYQRTCPIDVRMKVSVTSATSYTAKEEVYRGFHTWAGIQRELEGQKIIQEVDSIIRSDFDLLLSNIWTGCGKSALDYSSSYSLLSDLHRTVQRLRSAHHDLRALIGEVLDKLELELSLKSVEGEYFVPVEGLELPPELNQIEFDDEVKVVRLSVDEVEALLDEQQLTAPMSTARYNFAIIIRFSTDFFVGPDFSLPFVCQQNEMRQKLDDKVAFCLQTFSTISSSGCPVVGFREYRFKNLIRSIALGRFSLIVRPIARNIEIDGRFARDVRELYSAIVANKNKQVALALSRLLDSLERLKPVDGLVDAMIGLEALLTPESSYDLNFRLQMNYAAIAAHNLRTERFAQMKELTEARGKVVHGHLLSDQKAYSYAENAREALRDALRWCLLRSEIIGAAKTAPNFWRDFLLLK